METLNELYQEMILDHNKHPKNRKVLEEANHQAEGYNPLCGDKVTIYLYLEKDRIVAASFEGEGCAISTASASMMVESIEGKTLQEIEVLSQSFRDTVMSEMDAPIDHTLLGNLASLAGVRQFPMRIKCATLPWHTLKEALQDRGEILL